MTKQLKWRRDTAMGQWYLELWTNNVYSFHVAWIPFSHAESCVVIWPSVGSSKMRMRVSYHSTQAAKKDLMEVCKEFWL